MSNNRRSVFAEPDIYIAALVLLLAACSYVVGGKNPFVVAPLPERACNGTWTADSAEVCRDTVTR